MKSGRIGLPTALYARQLAARGGERIGILWLIHRGHCGDQRSNSDKKAQEPTDQRLPQSGSSYEIVLSVLRPGDLIGEFEAVEDDGCPRTASNVALEAVDTRVMRGEDFRCYLESHPGAALALLRAIIHRLRNADQRRIDSGSRDTVRRLAHLLAELADEHGRSTSAGIDIDIPLTQQELASLVAASRESIVRSLRSLRSRRLVTTGRRRITIRDLDGLRREADGQ